MAVKGKKTTATRTAESALTKVANQPSFKAQKHITPTPNAKVEAWAQELAKSPSSSTTPRHESECTETAPVPGEHESAVSEDRRTPADDQHMCTMLLNIQTGMNSLVNSQRNLEQRLEKVQNHLVCMDSAVHQHILRTTNMKQTINNIQETIDNLPELKMTIDESLLDMNDTLDDIQSTVNMNATNIDTVGKGVIALLAQNIMRNDPDTAPWCREMMAKFLGTAVED